jgi:hypothetical protein
VVGLVFGGITQAVVERRGSQAGWEIADLRARALSTKLRSFLSIYLFKHAQFYSNLLKIKRKFIEVACQTKYVEISTPKRYRESRIKHVTPPPQLSFSEGQHETPQRVGVFLCKEIGFQKGILMTQKDVFNFTGVPSRVQTDILKSKEVRMLHNRLEPQEPDPRAPIRIFTH